MLKKKKKATKESKYIVWFKQVDKKDIPEVGGKGANLGEMVSFGIPVPPGFIVTSGAYFYFLEKNNLRVEIKRILQTVDVHNAKQLNDASQKIRQLIRKGDIPQDLAKQIAFAYDKLGGSLKQTLVAIRSSATAEDLPDASFAGQQETFLNVKGESNVIEKVRDAWSSLFTPRAIFYREQKNFDHFKVGIAVPVQKMVQSKSSGVVFTIEPVTNDKNIIVVEAIWGLGELIVQGSVTPDHYEVNKKSFEIISKQINKQEVQLIKTSTSTKKTKVKKSLQKKQKLSDKLIVQLAKIGKKIHQHYFFPQDIEWALEKNKLYIVQTRPVTTIVKESDKEKKETEKERIDLPIILEGDPASPGIVSGYARIIKSAKEIGKVKSKEILITDMTTPDFVPAMKKVVGIITNKGGQTSHAAIVSRELGVACIVGTDKATQLIKTGQVITMNAATGKVYKGSLSTQKKSLAKQPSETMDKRKFDYLSRIKTATKVYVNLGEPDLALEIAKRNIDGVGLLRAEFMISEYIGIHPRKLIRDKKQKIFVNKLAEGIEKFCRAFEGRPVVYRATDFKTNEYANLTGGKEYEPQEANPMLGYRGAFRYIHDEAVFELELKAIKKVRNKLGLKNLWLMIPFVHTIEELQKVKKIIASTGLNRSPSFKLWMMVEVPSNVILLDKFIDVGIDGVSIGTNDLTMLILGIDRDNEEVTPVFDERNEAVLWALQRVIKICLKHKISSSICGQAPSVYPELTQKLVKWGITSVSVSPDMIEQTREIIYEAEKKSVDKNG